MNTLILFMTILLLLVYNEAKNLLEEIKSMPDLSEMASIIQSDSLLPALMQSKGFTAFIPSNEAMARYNGTRGRKLVYYHLTNVPSEVQDLPSEVTTELTGNPRLYVKRIPTGRPAITGWENNDIYINNGKVTSANHRAKADEGALQYLHIIDEVLVPTLSQSKDLSSPSLYKYPDAQDIIVRPYEYGFSGNYSLSEFKKRIETLNLMGFFNVSGKNTFFIPVDEAITSPVKTPQKDLIDRQVVLGHIVPGEVLFTRTISSPREQFHSQAFMENLKVLITMESFANPEGKGMIDYVKSSVLAGDRTHKKGTVVSRIIKGNIPVKNGVIHLIDRTLMVIPTSVVSYLRESRGQLSQFYQLLQQHAPDLSASLAGGKEFTVFAPSNEAFKVVDKEKLDKLKLNNEEIEKLINLHVVPWILTTEEIVEKSSKEIFQAETLDTKKKLYFAVSDPNDPFFTVSLEGAGVNASITTANIATRNGAIHIINRILGIPSQTIMEKLASDPMLSATYSLSMQEGWINRLGSREEQFTLFVPSNDAWDFIRREMPSAHKKLFMGGFSYHVKYILERHLIAGEGLRLEELVALTTQNGTIKDGLIERKLQMMRDRIYFQAHVRDTFGGRRRKKQYYYVEWSGISARVIRPDVECVNGVVHVIDKVLMMSRDVTVNVAAYTVPAVATLGTMLLAWLLH